MIDMCLDDFPAIVLAMTAAADCVALHEDYMGVVHSLCGMALYVACINTSSVLLICLYLMFCCRPGSSLVLLACIVTGLLLSLLIILASRAWRNFSRRYDTSLTNHPSFSPHVQCTM